ncbi:MAG: prepilin-type N-terminal cleavage/methylation domain [Herbinix sp.]|jgi:type IV pilus assembly protein PilA|nr:prepilin-type N-terminal cleavage/methylation domain [Herbinix sp.]
MKKLTKKNNKGFTLVELIVVVLIMAILAAALAPQVMKWVNNSRKSSDVTMYENIVSATELSLSDEVVYKALYNASTAVVATISIYDTDQNTTTAGNQYVVVSNTTLEDKLIKIIGNDFITTKPKVDITDPYIITITNGILDKTRTPDSTMD